MNNEIMTLNWMGTSKHASKAADDVSIRISAQEVRNCVLLTFRNDSFKKFTDTDYFLLAPYKNRIFFKRGDANNGVLLSANKTALPTTRYSRLQSGNINTTFAQFAGDYKLMHDDFYDLYYIERKED